MRHMRLWAAALLLAAILAAWGLPAKAEEKKQTKEQKQEEAAALVNGVVIARSDVEAMAREYEARAQAMGKSKAPQEKGKLEREVLDNLINTELLYQQSKKEGITVDPKAVDAEYARWARRFPDAKKRKELMEAWNLTEKGIKEKIAHNMAVGRFVEEKFSKEAVVSDKELQEYYDAHPEYFKEPERIRARHILIKVPSGAKEEEKAEARKKIEALSERIKKGEDFSTLAKENSDCPSKARGGDLGFFGRGQMVKPFEEAAFALEPGQVSGIVETPFGYHLIKCEEKKPEGKVPLDRVKPQLKAYLEKEKERNLALAYVEELRKKAKIQIFLK